MKKVMVISMVLGAFALSTLTVLAPSSVLAQETCEANVNQPVGPCKTECKRECDGDSSRSDCYEECNKFAMKTEIETPPEIIDNDGKGPCDGKPGTKWCPKEKSCVPVADWTKDRCSGKNPILPSAEICLFTGLTKGLCPDGCPDGQILASDGKSCVLKCDTDVCASDVMALIQGLKDAVARLEAKLAPADVDLRLLYVFLGVIVFLLLAVLVRQGKKAPTKCNKCGKTAVFDGICHACWEPDVPPPPTTPAPPTATTPASPPDTQTK